MAPGVLSPTGRKKSFYVSPKDRESLDETIFDALHESAMRDATVLFYNTPLLIMQQAKGIIPKRAKTLEAIYKVMLKNAFEAKRCTLSLPKSSSHEDICKAMAQNFG